MTTIIRYSIIVVVTSLLAIILGVTACTEAELSGTYELERDPNMYLELRLSHGWSTNWDRLESTEDMSYRTGYWEIKDDRLILKGETTMHLSSKGLLSGKDYIKSEFAMFGRVEGDRINMMDSDGVVLDVWIKKK